MSSENILRQIQWLADMNGYELTKFAPKIAAAKERFFGEKDWSKCPCDPDSDRSCISEHCHQDIKLHGHCHCNCYKLKGVDDD